MKATRTLLRVLAAIFALGTVALFFFKFVEVSFADLEQTLQITGTQLVFGQNFADKLGLGADGVCTIYKSGWFFLSFFITALTAVFAIIGVKSKGTTIASLVFGLFSFIILLVILITNPAGYVDLGMVEEQFTVETVKMLLYFYLSIGAIFLSVVCSAIGILVNNKIEVIESNGKVLTIPQKVKQFFKDYIAEIKRIDWPTIKTVVKNSIVVLVMCAIVGAFIWLVDWGVSSGIGALFKSKEDSTSTVSTELTTSTATDLTDLTTSDATIDSASDMVSVIADAASAAEAASNTVSNS